MTIQWATTDTFCTTDAIVQFGFSATNLDQTQSGVCVPFSLVGMFEQSNKLVYLTDLTPKTTYFYRVGESDDGDWSDIYYFTTAPDVLSTDPQRFLIFGDLAASSSGE